MTFRERLLTAYQCREPDRVPIHVRGVPANEPEYREGKHESFRPLWELVLAECETINGYRPRRRKGCFFDSDAVRIERHERDEGEWVCHETIVHTPKGPINYVRQESKGDYPSLTHTYWITDDDDDLERYLSLPADPAGGDFSDYPDAVERAGDRAVLMTGLIDPIAHVHDLLGSEKLALWSIERRRDVDMLVELFTERLLESLGASLAAGVTCMYGFVGAEYCGPPLMSPRDFHDWVTQPMKRITAKLHAADVLVHVHSHGPLDALLEDFADMGANVLHPLEAPPMGDVAIADAKRRIGRRVCLEGNVQVGDLYTCEEHEIRDQVKRLIDDAAPGGGFVLCPTASPYTPILPNRALRNYIAMIEAAIEYGR